MIEEAILKNKMPGSKEKFLLRIRDQLRDTIIDAIDQNDRFGQSSYSCSTKLEHYKGSLLEL